MSSFTGLPPDALLHLLALLPPRDIAALASTCRLLRSCASQGSLWRQQCEAWLEAQRLRPNSAGRPAHTAAQLLAALQLGSYRTLFTGVLHRLGSWPEGLWYATSEVVQPRGSLMVCLLHPPTASLGFCCVKARALDGPPSSPDECWELKPPLLTIRADPGGGSSAGTGAQPRLVLTSESLGHDTLDLSLDGQQLTLRNSAQPRSPAASLGAAVRTLHTSISTGQPPGSASEALASLASLLGLSAQRVQVESASFQRVPLPAACDLQAVEGEPPGMALLRPLQGVFTGSYGPHGMEVLSLQAYGPAEEGEGRGHVPPLCPISGPRLQALKLLGDPNVPALKHSFVVDASSCQLGPYAAHDDPFAPEGGPARPVLAFFRAAILPVDLEQRPVAARFRAVGCINVVPGEWNPEWVPATCVLYHPPMHRTLTIIFEDQDQPFRHAIDYQEFPFAREFMPGA